MMDMRSLQAAPTQMVAHAFFGNGGQGMIEHVDVPGQQAPVILQRLTEKASGSW